MGRARKVAQYCAFRRLAADQGGFADHATYRKVETWCGESPLMGERERAEPLKLATCPKCAAAIGKARLAALKGRVVLERMETPPSYWRSGYVVLIDGTPRGLIGVANGWGERWRLHRIPKPDSWNGLGAGVACDPPNRYDAQRWPVEGEHAARYVAWPVHHAAKEAMAAAAWTFYERGDLPTLEEAAALEEAAKAARAVEEGEREARRLVARQEAERRESERLERVAIWRDALASLDGRADLTNMERAGLEAIKLLYPTG